MDKPKENDMEIDVLDQTDHLITIRLDGKNKLKIESLKKFGAVAIQIYHEKLSGFYDLIKVDGSYFILPNKTTRFKNVVYKLIYPHQNEKSLLKLVSEKLFNDSKLKSE